MIRLLKKENLDCHDLIKEFEKNYAAKKTTDSKRKGSAPASSAADEKKRGEGEKPRRFGRGLDPERIIGATDSSGELKFLIKWKGKKLTCDQCGYSALYQSVLKKHVSMVHENIWEMRSVNLLKMFFSNERLYLLLSVRK